MIQWAEIATSTVACARPQYYKTLRPRNAIQFPLFMRYTFRNYQYGWRAEEARDGDARGSVSKHRHMVVMAAAPTRRDTSLCQELSAVQSLPNNAGNLFI